MPLSAKTFIDDLLSCAPAIEARRSCFVREFISLMISNVVCNPADETLSWNETEEIKELCDLYQAIREYVITEVNTLALPDIYPPYIVTLRQKEFVNFVTNQNWLLARHTAAANNNSSVYSNLIVMIIDRLPSAINDKVEAIVKRTYGVPNGTWHPDDTVLSEELNNQGKLFLIILLKFYA